MECVDRLQEIKNFDDSKIGVKGLLDSGITSIPQIFVHPLGTLSDLKPRSPTSTKQIPIVDFSDLNSYHRRLEIVDKIREASSTWGFFQIINHGISKTIMDEAISSVRLFHELPAEVKRIYYGRGENVCYMSNSDIYLSEAASWRDTLKIILGPGPLEVEKIPKVCRDQLVKWAQHAKSLGGTLLELMCEGLGVRSGLLNEMGCTQSNIMLGQFYPCCPQPDRTVGIVPHTDQSIITMLIQDQIGGLQVKHGEEWVNVKPIEGSITINVGDFLQIITNDKYKSAEHRVLANGSSEPRISIPIFCHPTRRREEDSNEIYGPLPELLSFENPPRYRNFTLTEFWKQATCRSLCRKNLINGFKIVREK